MVKLNYIKDNIDHVYKDRIAYFNLRKYLAHGYNHGARIENYFIFVEVFFTDSNITNRRYNNYIETYY